MTTTRLRKVVRGTTLWLAGTTAFACSGPAPDFGQGEGTPVDFSDVGLDSEALTDLSGQCSYADGAITLTLNSGDIAILSRTSANAIAVNGYACGAATTSNIRTIAVEEGTAGAQVIVIDYQTGLFAAGRSTGAGIDVDLGGGLDSLRIRGQTGNDSMTMGANGIAVNNDGNLDITHANVEGVMFALGAGNDTFSGAGTAGGTGAALTSTVVVYGGTGNDTLRGGTGADSLYGGAGNDTFNAGTAPDGGDYMSGGDGTDTVTYQSRTAVVVATASVSVTIDGVANDGNGSEGDNVDTDIENVTGTSVNDTLTGGTGNNTLNGGDGDDTLSAGGGGSDTLNGGAGNDTFDCGTSTDGATTMVGGAGTDTADYSARTSSLTITLDNRANDGEDSELDNVKSDVENVIGGSLGDNITGSSSANSLEGGDGDDTLSGGAGNDTLVGGAGDDDMDGGAGDDVFDCGTSSDGADAMAGGAGTDLVDYSGRTASVSVSLDDTANDGRPSEGDDVASDIENVSTGDGDDSITGSSSNNVISGGAGNDTIDGAAGNDTISGGAGNDIIDGGDGDDTVDGETGTDTLDCGAGDSDICIDPADCSGATACEL